MNREQISKLLGSREMPLVDAMSKIDQNARGILFIVDENGKLTGSITDGDIRRWLIKTGDLNAAVDDAMMHTPVSLYQDEKNRAFDVMKQKKITALPLLSPSGVLEDIILPDETVDDLNSIGSQRLAGVPVVIMAGGQGSRLYPYTKILPKPLIPVGETPIIGRVLNLFVQYGADKFYITVNYKKDMIKSYFSDLKPSYELVYVEEDKPLGTGGGIKLIKDHFESPLFVANCDSLILTDYGDLYDYHIKSENLVTIVSSVKNMIIPYGVLRLKEDGELIDMEEKPKLSYFINTGMYVINPEVIGLIPEDTMFHMTDLVEAVMQKGGKVGVYPVSEDSFLDMGEFDEMQRMENKLKIIED